MDTLSARTRVWHLSLATLALTLLLASAAHAITPLDAGSMEARVLILNSVSFDLQSPRASVTEARGTLTWYPRASALQEVRSIETSPQPFSHTDERMVFLWQHPKTTEEISVESIVRTRNAIVPVRERIPFPIQSVPVELSMYLQEGEITDQSPRIQQLAQELAAGKSDAYEVVFALADWTTRNVNYSLASLRAPAIQTSSQVLESRYGKCDELTALFISMCRSLGIPARFVAGYSYTNSDLFTQSWGGHGWAEVWLPDVGWVPFDVTYGEYGYLDAGHIQLKTSVDAKETSIDYSASGYQFELKTTPLDVIATPLHLEENTDTRLHITLDTPYKTVGFGSTILILARVENLKDYYVSTRLDLAHTSNTEMLSDTYHNVLLKPHETITVPFLIKIDTQLNERMYYEFPFRIFSRLGESETITITVTPQGKVYTQAMLQEIIDEYVEQAPTRAPFGVACDRATGYTGGDVTHTCTVDGPVGDSLRICRGQTCEMQDITDGTFILRNTAGTQGVRTITYTASSLGVSAQFFVTEHSVAPTTLAIAIEAPQRMTPPEQAPIAIELTHEGALPENITVTFTARHASATEHIKDLRTPARVEFTLPARTLRPGENRLLVHVEYTDELGTRGSAQSEAIVLLEEVRFVDRLAFWIEDAGLWLEGLVS